MEQTDKSVSTSSAPEISRSTSPRNSQLQRYSGEQFLTAYNPDRQIGFVRQPERCVTGTAPKLWEVSKAYGPKVMETWVEIQLRDINEFAGNRDKLSTRQIEQLAKIVATDYYYLKVTEFILFCHKFKSGEYGRFYGAVDTITIMEALRSFCDWRRYVIIHAESDARREELLRKRPDTVSFSDYAKQRGLDCASLDEFIEKERRTNI
jgi:hypothetical protein